MKNLILMVMIFSLSHVQAQLSTVEMKKVDALVKQMTLEEKVGQMTQVTMAVYAENGWGNQNGKFDPERVKEAVQKYHVGSMLNNVNRALSLDEWHAGIKMVMDECNRSRLKIPVIYGLDAMHGQNYTLNSTVFPHNLAIGATRNDALVAKIAQVTAKELRGSGVRWNFAPVLDIGRQQLWARFEETFSEDPTIIQSMGKAAIQAYEGPGLKHPTAVATSLKHYMGYSNPRTGKDRTPTSMSDIEMREYYLPQFAAAIKAGASSVMVNSGEVNGVPVHGSKYILQDILRKELGFDGVVVSDWEDIIRLHTRHRVAESPRAAVVMGVNAGIDMSMVPSDYSFYDLLLEAVKKGEVSTARINEAVKRILILKMRLGLFDNPYPEPEAIANFGKSEYEEVALQAAHEAITLLKNKDLILPLTKDKKILLAGPGAQSVSALHGAWSYTWQGNDERYYPTKTKTIAQALVEKGGDQVIIAGSKGWNHKDNFDGERLKALALIHQVDAIILCLGEDAYAETPGNTRELDLPSDQKMLAEAAIATGKPVILVLVEGRPRFITDIEPKMHGVIMAYRTGSKAAEGLADILYGDYNPSGKLPFTYNKYAGEMLTYDYKLTEALREDPGVNAPGYDPLYPFGFGLSYTDFEYSDIKLDHTVMTGNSSLEIKITVKNTGKVAGDHAIDLYTSDLFASISPPGRRLRAYQKVYLAAGESKEVSFKINKDDLSFINAQSKRVTEPGDFEVIIGDKKAGFRYEN
ncbi:MAG: glycoside hydrolase family 3 C-terminal domain-containing protein [Saprospiraceae bacterium]|jgi:beta-glucosidase|nr:glycoside hydrolase family 3 C-terminal domain-containing protein [Saprospiraceae bacterium]